jgi:putative transposase
MYNNEDLSSIQVWGPDSEQPLRVLALNQEYTKGLTSLQNELMRAVIHEKGARQTDPVALQQARQDIIETVESLMNSRKQKDRRKAATILGTSSSKPNESLTGGLVQTSTSGEHGANKTKPKTRSKPDTRPDDTDRPPIKYAFFQQAQDADCGSNQ